jgi:hypothetical protein
MKGKWRIIKMPDYTSDYPDMVEPAYISFDGKGGGQFTFGCVTGAIYGAGDGNAIEFTWDGNDEMDDASGDGWAELQRNGALKDKSASTAEIKPTSLRGHGRLLQQPARTVTGLATLGAMHLHSPSEGWCRYPNLRLRPCTAAADDWLKTLGNQCL